MEKTVKQIFLTSCIAVISLCNWACSKPRPVAAIPPPVVADTKPAPAAETPRVVQRTEPTKPVQVAKEQPAQRASTMSAKEKEDLNKLLSRLSDALFDYDRATIRPDAMQSLQGDVNVIRGILSDYPTQKLTIEGHADERGSAEYNLALGDKRAVAAKEFLSSMGIPQTQLTVISYGKDRPTCHDATESCWQQNRRAHITAQ